MTRSPRLVAIAVPIAVAVWSRTPLVHVAGALVSAPMGFAACVIGNIRFGIAGAPRSRLIRRSSGANVERSASQSRRPQSVSVSSVIDVSGTLTDVDGPISLLLMPAVASTSWRMLA